MKRIPAISVNSKTTVINPLLLQRNIIQVLMLSYDGNAARDDAQTDHASLAFPCLQNQSRRATQETEGSQKLVKMQMRKLLIILEA